MNLITCCECQKEGASVLANLPFKIPKAYWHASPIAWSCQTCGLEYGAVSFICQSCYNKIKKDIRNMKWFVLDIFPNKRVQITTEMLEEEKRLEHDPGTTQQNLQATIGVTTLTLVYIPFPKEEE